MCIFWGEKLCCLFCLTRVHAYILYWYNCRVYVLFVHKIWMDGKAFQNRQTFSVCDEMVGKTSNPLDDNIMASLWTKIRCGIYNRLRSKAHESTSYLQTFMALQQIPYHVGLSKKPHTDCDSKTHRNKVRKKHANFDNANLTDWAVTFWRTFSPFRFRSDARRIWL